MLINLKKELANWRYERYMGLILHGSADCGKSQYALKMTKSNEELAIFYFDLLEAINGFGDKGIILRWNPKTFMDWLLSELKGQINTPQKTVIVDHIDFLFNLWDHTKKEEFIQRLSHIEKAIFDKPILFILQNDPVINQIKENPDTSRKPFIISYNELESI